MQKPLIETQRTYFSLWNEDSLSDANLLWGDPAVSKYISISGIFSEKEILTRLNKEISNQQLYGIQYWPFYEKDSNTIIGCCGFRPYSHNTLEFGIHIRSSFWRQGLAFESATAAIRYCNNNLKPEKIVAGHNLNNIASANLLKKLGFIFTHTEYYEPTGLMHPTYMLNI